jgi:hypothetical protein
MPAGKQGKKERIIPVLILKSGRVVFKSRMENPYDQLFWLDLAFDTGSASSRATPCAFAGRSRVDARPARVAPRARLQAWRDRGTGPVAGLTAGAVWQPAGLAGLGHGAAWRDASTGQPGSLAGLTSWGPW